MSLLACRPPAQTEGSVVATALPHLPVYEITPRADSLGFTVRAVSTRDPLANIPASKRVTLVSNNADARTLLLWLAQQGDVSLVVSQDVQARVSVNFRDVWVADAMRAVLAEAGLSVLIADAMSPWPPVVFYRLPVNVNEVSAEAIAERFGVSGELARWILESKPKP